MLEEITLHTGQANCMCSGCTSVAPQSPSDASVDGMTGTAANGKAYWTPDQIAAYLNRTGAGFANGLNHGPQSDADLSVIKFGFHTGQQSLFDNGYVYFSGGRGFGFSEYFNFQQFNAAQKDAAREAI